MGDCSIEGSKSGLMSPFRSIRLRQRMEARRNVTSMDQRYPVTRLSSDNFGTNHKLTDEIDDLIRKQKANLKEDFEMAKLRNKCETPIHTREKETPLPSHHKLKAAVFASGDTDGAEDEENIEWGGDDTFISENIEEAPVSVINPSSIRTGLAKGVGLTKNKIS